MRKFLSLACTLVILSWFHPAAAFLFSRISLPYMVPRSDLIVRGRVLKVEGPIEGKMRGIIEVDRVLTGELQGSEAKVFLLPNLINPRGPFPQSVAPGDYDLFFLKKDGDQLVAVNPYHLKFPVRQGNPVVQPNSDALEAVRSELLWSLTPEKLFSVEDERILAQAEGETEEIRVATRRYTTSLNVLAVEQLADFPPDENTNKRLKELLSSPNIDVNFRGRIIEALLQQNQPQALAPAAEYIQNNAQSKNPVVQETTRNIGSSISLIHDPAGFSDLVPLISHPDAKVRASAIIAMATLIQELKFPPGPPVVPTVTEPPSVASPQGNKTNGSTTSAQEPKKKPLTPRLAAAQVVPLLIQRLDDDDTQVRFQTILALTEITSQPGKGPGYAARDKDYKRSDEQPYISYWKQWWAHQPPIK